MADNQPIRQMIERARQDATLQDALRSARTVDDVIRAAAEAGIKVSLEDLKAHQVPVGDGELSESDLEHVAGGFLPYFERMPSSWEGTVTPEKWRI